MFSRQPADLPNDGIKRIDDSDGIVGFFVVDGIADRPNHDAFDGTPDLTSLDGVSNDYPDIDDSSAAGQNRVRWVSQFL